MWKWDFVLVLQPLRQVKEEGGSPLVYLYTNALQLSHTLVLLISWGWQMSVNVKMGLWCCIHLDKWRKKERGHLCTCIIIQYSSRIRNSLTYWMNHWVQAEKRTENKQTNKRKKNNPPKSYFFKGWVGRGEATETAQKKKAFSRIANT